MTAKKSDLSFWLVRERRHKKLPCARIILRASEGSANNAIATQLGISRPTVLLWRNRFRQFGMPGLLRDAKRTGRKKAIPPALVQRVVEATLQTVPKDATHWSTRSMAKAQELSRLAEVGIEPSVGSVGDSYDNALAETINGRIGKRWNWRRWTGWTGSTTNDCWDRSGTSRQRKPKRLTIGNKRGWPKRLDSHQRVSGIPGAVQALNCVMYAYFDIALAVFRAVWASRSLASMGTFLLINSTTPIFFNGLKAT